MRVICEKDPELSRTLHVRPEGRLDALGASHLWDAVSDRISEETPTVLLDMRNVRLMSSAGITTFIRFLTRARKLQGSLSIYGCSNVVTNVLRDLNLEAVFNLRATEEEAKERLRELGVA